MPKSKKKNDNVLRFGSDNLGVWLVPILVVLGILGSLVLVMVPAVQNTMTMRDEITLKNDEHEKLISRRLFLETLNEAALERDLATVERVLGSSKPVFELMFALAVHADTHEVTVDTYDLSPGVVSSPSAEEDVEVSDLKFLDLDFGVSGPKENVYAFMEELNYLSPLFDIEGVSMTDSSVVLEVNEGEEAASALPSDEFSVAAELRAHYSERPQVVESSQRAQLTDIDSDERALLRDLEEFVNYLEEIEPREDELNLNRATIFDY